MVTLTARGIAFNGHKEAVAHLYDTGAALDDTPVGQVALANYAVNPMTRAEHGNDHQRASNEDAVRQAAVNEIERMIALAKGGLDGGGMTDDRRALIDRLESLKDQVSSGVAPVSAVQLILDRAKDVTQAAMNPTAAESGIRNVVYEAEYKTLKAHSSKQEQDVQQARGAHAKLNATRPASTVNEDLSARVASADADLDNATRNFDAALADGDTERAKRELVTVTQAMQRTYGAQSADAVYAYGMAHAEGNEETVAAAREVLSGNRARLASAIAEEIAARELAGETMTQEQKDAFTRDRVEAYEGALRQGYEQLPEQVRNRISFEQFEHYVPTAIAIAENTTPSQRADAIRIVETSLLPQLGVRATGMLDSVYEAALSAVGSIKDFVSGGTEVAGGALASEAATGAEGQKDKASEAATEGTANPGKAKDDAVAAAAPANDKVAGGENVADGATVEDKTKTTQAAQAAVAEKKAEEKATATVAV